MIGTFDRKLSELASFWKPAQTALMATELASVAATTGQYERGQHWIARADEIAHALDDRVVTPFVAMAAFPWALLRDDFTSAARSLVRVRGEREGQPGQGESEVARYALLAAFRLATMMLPDPERAREGMSALSGALREIRNDPDASTIADIFDAVQGVADREDLASLALRIEPGTAVGSVLRVFQSVSNRRNTADRAVDHLAVGPAATRRSVSWGIGYDLIVVPFFESFWRREVANNAFRFRNPAAFRHELEEIGAIAPQQRVQAILKIVSDALDLNIPRGFREWFSGLRV